MDSRKKLYLFIGLCAFLGLGTAEKEYGGYIFTSPKKLNIGKSNELQMFRSGCTDKGKVIVGAYYNKSLVYEEEYKLQKGKVVSFFDFAVPTFKMAEYDNDGELKINGTICGTSISGSDGVTFGKPDSDIGIIQTDKPFYKPGQTVKFRVFEVNRYLKPSGNPNDVADIFVEDPRGTRLFQFNNVSIAKGIVQREFPLADEPVKGSWRITVSRNGDEISTSFDVKDYVLPKFDVKVNFPPFVLTNAKTFPVEVCAKYTYGEPLRGELNLNVSQERYYYYGDRDKKMPVLQKSVKLDGCYKYTVNVSLIDPEKQPYRRIMAVVNIVESGTGIQLNKTEYLHRESEPLRLDFNADQNQLDLFKPGLPYTGRLKVSNPDNTPAPREPIEICAIISRQRVIYEWWSSRKVQFCSNYTSDAKGYVRYSIMPQNVDTVSISLEARSLKYARVNSGESDLSEPRASKYLNPFYSPSGSFIQIAPIEKPLECGAEQPIKIIFTSKESGDYKLYYEVIKGGVSVQKGKQILSFDVKDDVSKKYEGKDKLINQKETQLVPPKGKPNSKEDCPAAKDSKYIPPIGETVLKIPIDATLPPSFKLLIFYTRDDKEVVADSQVIDVKGCFNNKVNFKFGDKVTVPGTKTSINIKSAPESLCGLKVVDKSVSLIDSSDQLTKDRIFQLLGENDYGYSYSPDPCYSKVPQPGLANSKAILPRPSGIYSSSSYEDSFSTFQKAGFLVISNLLLFTRPCRNSDSFDGSTFNGGYGGAVPMMAKNGRAIQIVPAGPGTTPGVVTAADSRPIRLNVPTTQSAAAVRENFAETWIFDLVMTGKDGKYVSEQKLPDTITDWVGNAVCINPQLGLGLSETASITGFQAFFISYTLPISVIRGEEFTVIVSIFNYVDAALPIRVDLVNSHGLEVVGKPIDADICIKPDTSTSLKLKLKATAVGNINITVAAETSKSKTACGDSAVYNKTARDAITQSLEVYAEGFPVEKVKSMLLCVSGKPSSQVIDLNLPEDVVPDSARAFADVGGNLLGPTTFNLNNLIQMPTGCGEQNIVKFTPNVLVMNYLSTIHQLTEDIKNKATQNLITGYQRQLTYRHYDGSFSAFGEDVDREGSMYLTAFVLESFSRAEQYITIDKSIITSMQKFIVTHQKKNGCFPNMGQVIDYGFQGGLDDEKNSHALTAYVVKSLLQSNFDNQTSINLAMSCLNQNRTLSFYETFLYAYTLALAGNKAEAIKLGDGIKPFAKSKDGMEYYNNPGKSRTVDIETAAYAILYKLKVGKDATDVLPLVRYLASNLNPTGGFYSTQDTVIGLLALNEFSKLTYKDPIDLTVVIKCSKEETVKVTEANKLLVQRTKVSTLPVKLKVDATGKGCGLVQTTLRYNKRTPPNEKKFSLDLEAICQNSDCTKGKINVAVSYLPTQQKAGMSVVQIKMVSGKSPVRDTLRKLVRDGENNIMRFDVENNVVVLYFSEVTNKGYLFSFDVEETIKVDKPQPANAKAFDYYAPESNVETNYFFQDSKTISRLTTTPAPPIKRIIIPQRVPDSPETHEEY